MIVVPSTLPEHGVWPEPVGLDQVLAHPLAHAQQVQHLQKRTRNIFVDVWYMRSDFSILAKDPKIISRIFFLIFDHWPRHTKVKKLNIVYFCNNFHLNVKEYNPEQSDN